MASVIGGCVNYTRGTVTIPVNFPNGEICCFWCPLMRRDREGRNVCEALHEHVYEEHHSVLEHCPVVLLDDK